MFRFKKPRYKIYLRLLEDIRNDFKLEKVFVDTGAGGTIGSSYSPEESQIRLNVKNHLPYPPYLKVQYEMYQEIKKRKSAKDIDIERFNKKIKEIESKFSKYAPKKPAPEFVNSTSANKHNLKIYEDQYRNEKYVTEKSLSDTFSGTGASIGRLYKWFESEVASRTLKTLVHESQHSKHFGKPSFLKQLQAYSGIKGMPSQFASLSLPSWEYYQKDGTKVEYTGGVPESTIQWFYYLILPEEIDARIKEYRREFKKLKPEEKNYFYSFYYLIFYSNSFFFKNI